jgi:hypothetical protein
MEECKCEWCATNREGFEAQFTEFDEHVGAAQSERLQKLGAGAEKASREQRLKSRRENLSTNYAQTWCNVTCAATLALDSVLISSGATDNPFSATVSELVQTPAFKEDLKAAYFDEPNPDCWASAKRSVYGTTVVQVLATNLLAEVLRKQKARNANAEALKKQIFDLSAAEQAKRSEAPHTLHAEMRHELSLLRKERMDLAQERIEMREVMERLIAQRGKESAPAVNGNEEDLEGFAPSHFALQRAQAIRVLSDEPRGPQPRGSSPQGATQRAPQRAPQLVRNFPPRQDEHHTLKDQLGEAVKPFAGAFVAYKQDEAESNARLLRCKSSSSQ